MATAISFCQTFTRSHHWKIARAWWLFLFTLSPLQAFALEISNAEYDAGKDQLKVEVSLGDRARRIMTLYDDGTGALLDSKSTRSSEVRFRVSGLSGGDVPCVVRVESEGLTDTAGVANAPSNCGGEPPPPPPPPPANLPPECAIVQPTADQFIAVGDSVYFQGSGSDPESGPLRWEWDFGGGADRRPTVPEPGDVLFDTAGSFTAILLVKDDHDALCTDRRAIQVDGPPIGLPPKVSEQPAPGNAAAGDADHVVLAFNDLGMHCADLGSWPFSILPLFNTVNSQVVRRGTQGSNRPRILDDGSVELRYSAASSPLDPVGPDSINSTSQNFPTTATADTATVRKTDFWDPLYPGGPTIVNRLFGGLLDPEPDEGLQTIANSYHGRYMPGIAYPYNDNTPQEFSAYDPAHDWFTAQGIPITSVDDQGRLNSYPLMRIQAVDAASGAVLATTDAVVPVSTEVDCRDCHALGEVAADPAARSGPGAPEFVAPASVDRVDVEAAAKHNILVLHDFKHGTHFVGRGDPVLCAGCHRSNALAEVGGPGGDASLVSMSEAMHGFHGQLQVDDMGRLLRAMDGEPVLIDPVAMDGSELPLIRTGPGIPMEQNCFTCHPGKITQCFRGAMFTAGQKCDDCHGGMLAVGGAFELSGGGTREPWADEPKCSSCHLGHGDLPVGSVAYDPADPAATPLEAVGSRFAENPGTLYRNSLDNHAGIACEGCHGSPHAIWPNRNPAANDNVTALQLQGHAGTIRECSVCHEAGSFPNGTLNGPHGMHPVNDPNWIKSKGDFYHEDFVWSGGQDRCAACHGADHRGTRLSQVKVDRVLRDADGVVRARLSAGDIVSCDLCHSLEKSFSD